MIERQVIVTWYTPAEKLPPENEIVLATVSGQNGFSRWSGAFALAKYTKKDGWEIVDYNMTCFEVIAWCDIDVYKGRSVLDQVIYEV